MDNLYEPYNIGTVVMAYTISRRAYYDFLGLLYNHIHRLKRRRGREKEVIDEVVASIRSLGFHVSEASIMSDYKAYKKLVEIGIKHNSLYGVSPWIFRKLREYANLVRDKDRVSEFIKRLGYAEPAQAARLIDRELKIERAKYAGLIGKGDRDDDM